MPGNASTCSIGGCLEDYEAVKWTGIDISCAYDINYYVPEFIREVTDQ